MPQAEITGRRSAAYSQWHRRALPNTCYVTDGDWFEQRRINGMLASVAYIETIEVPKVDGAQYQYPLWPSKGALCSEIEARMRIPTYVTWHNEECSDFLVLRHSNGIYRRMTEPVYKRFIENLGMKP